MKNKSAIVSAFAALLLLVDINAGVLACFLIVLLVILRVLPG